MRAVTPIMSASSAVYDMPDTPRRCRDCCARQAYTAVLGVTARSRCAVMLRDARVHARIQVCAAHAMMAALRGERIARELILMLYGGAYATFTVADAATIIAPPLRLII